MKPPLVWRKWARVAGRWWGVEKPKKPRGEGVADGLAYLSRSYKYSAPGVDPYGE